MKKFFPQMLPSLPPEVVAKIAQLCAYQCCRGNRDCTPLAVPIQAGCQYAFMFAEKCLDCGYRHMFYFVHGHPVDLINMLYMLPLGSWSNGFEPGLLYRKWREQTMDNWYTAFIAIAAHTESKESNRRSEQPVQCGKQTRNGSMRVQHQ